MPDVEIRPDNPPSYALNLEQRRLLFDFVVDYLPVDSVLVSSGAVPEVDETMIESFRGFLGEAVPHSVFSDPGSRELDSLRKIADDMGWGPLVLDSIDRLEEAIEQEFARGFSPKLEGYIRAALKREISLRWKDLKLISVPALTGTPSWEEAIDLLQDLKRYRQVLKG